MAETANAVVPMQSSLVEAMATEYGVEPAKFLSTLRATILPKEVTNDEAAVFLITAHKYHLNPFLKEIYCFPKKGGGLQTVVGIDGWANLINQHPQFDGADFKEHHDKNGKVIGMTCRIHRKDRSQPIAVTEYLAECMRQTDVWKQWPLRMLRHRAFIQCGRYAFGFAGLLDPEEADYSGYKHMRDVSTPPGNRDAGPPLQIDQFPKENENPEPPDATQPPAAEGEAAAPVTDSAAPPPAPKPAPKNTTAPKNSEEYLQLVRSTCAASQDPEQLRAWWVSDQQRRLRFNAGVTGEETKQGKDLVMQRIEEMGS